MTNEEFRQWRRRMRMTQAQAAAALERSKRQIESYERGEAKIPLIIELATETLERRLHVERT